MAKITHESTNGMTEEILNFRDGKRIMKGSCFGHSQQGGCVTYSGIDMSTGQIVSIKEWTIDINEDEKTVGGKTANEIVTDIEKQEADLKSLRHKNLIPYKGVLCNVIKDRITIFVLQDSIPATSVFAISGSLGWTTEGASMVAKGILEVLIYLHNNGVSHNNLTESSVFIDNSGCVRVADFQLIPQIQELINGQQCVGSDLSALGTLVESLLNVQSSEMKDFINLCRSEQTISASDLLEHPFLRPLSGQDGSKNIHEPLCELKLPSKAQLDQSHQSTTNSSFTDEKSRLQTEFEIVSFIGKGAYGGVLKVRNILDKRLYALKSILLPAQGKQLSKKITREVELLSGVNHENVVRYYNSWVEQVSLADLQQHGVESSCDWLMSAGSSPSREVTVTATKKDGFTNPELDSTALGASIIDDYNNDDDDDDNDFDYDYDDYNDDDSSDGIEFQNSNGKVELNENDNKRATAANEKKMCMFIQMELCENSTLRSAIDSELYKDMDRVWCLFREIVEGLSHIHQQGMIHRDLKPVNIFLDSRGHAKIGDFGLATTSILALQNQQESIALSHLSKSHDMGSSRTGYVGTALYTAPELTGNASKSTYNQKVDLYSLGIILFEMSLPLMSTATERIKTLMDLRLDIIRFPDHILTEDSYTQQIKVIRWLLNHNPNKRPTTDELLSSELIPPTLRETEEMQGMIRQVLSNPQSRHYKYLIANCFAQENMRINTLNYHLDMVPITPRFDYVKSKIVSVFRGHGAIELVTPLLSLQQHYTHANVVNLMTHSGSIVSLPYDLRIPFLWHVALNGIKSIRRFSIERVYREKKAFNFHPTQLYQCVLDIVTPKRGDPIVDAELLSIANEIMNGLNHLSQQENMCFSISHISLLRSILLYCKVPVDKHKQLCNCVLDFLYRKTSKLQLLSTIKSQIAPPGINVNADYLFDALVTKAPLWKIANKLLPIINEKNEAARLAIEAIRYLGKVTSVAKSLGVNMPIIINPGLHLKHQDGDVVWRLMGKLNGKKTNQTIIYGGRYDTKLAEFQKSAVNNGIQTSKVDLSCAGLSFTMDKLVNDITSSSSGGSVDVMIYIADSSGPPMEEVGEILRSLWSSGIKTSIFEGNIAAEDSAEKAGADVVLAFNKKGEFRVLTRIKGHYFECHVSRSNLLSYILEIVRPPAAAVINKEKLKLRQNWKPKTIHYSFFSLFLCLALCALCVFAIQSAELTEMLSSLIVTIVNRVDVALLVCVLVGILYSIWPRVP